MNPTWPVHFWFDSTTAGFGASGRWNHNASHQDAVLVRCVFQLLEARCCAGVYYGHVKAHQGDPYNELVNTLAYDALMTLRCNPVLDFVVADMLQGDKPLCAHWVTVFLASSGESQYPGFEYGAYLSGQGIKSDHIATSFGVTFEPAQRLVARLRCRH